LANQSLTSSRWRLPDDFRSLFLSRLRYNAGIMLLLLADVDVIYWMLIFFIAIVGIVGMVIMRGLFLAWRRQTQRFNARLRQAQDKRSENPPMDTWKESGRRLLQDGETAMTDEPSAPMDIPPEDFELRHPHQGDDLIEAEDGIDDEMDDDEDDDEEDDDDPYGLFRKPQ